MDKLGAKNVIRKTIKQFPKTDVRYWREKVAFQTPASRTLSIQIQHAGNRAWIALGTANRDQAAFQARKLYEELRANGWEETMRRRKGIPAEKKVNITIGEFISAVRQESMIYPKTIESYAQALRKIAGDITEYYRVSEKRVANVSGEKTPTFHVAHEKWTQSNSRTLTP